jgi:hypothetical protein
MFAASKTAKAVSAAATDPQFPYVTMLLHGDGTNGAQNNTFLDSSTNNFTITRNGNTTQGTWSPYGSNWSNYFDGSSYLSVASTTALNQNNNFTVEAWIYIINTPSTTIPFYGFEVNGFLKFALNTSLNLTVDKAGVGVQVTGSSVLQLSSWNHVAFVRNGSSTNNCKIYLNGIQNGQFTDTSNVTVSGAGTIFARPDTPSNVLTGYLSNLRVTNTAVYTSEFTPSTIPLTAVSGTQLLTCQSNRLIDNSTNNLTITKNGSPSVQRFSPFSPTSAYTTSVIGGSGYFDGSGDYLTTASSTAFGMGTGDFTIESWVYCTSLGATQTINDARTANTASAYVFAVFSSGALNFYDGPNNTDRTSASGLISLNTWTHVLASRSGTTLKLFVNGAVVSTFTGISSDFGSNQSCTVGRQVSGSGQFNGYITDLRILKGTAVTTAFTPPTAPLTAITNTSLLTNFTNAGILDNAEMNDLETVGNAQISTSVKKYGTGSMYFDGSGDYLTLPSTPNLGFSSGDFTVEAWVYLTVNIANATGGYLTDFRGGSTNNFALGFIGDSGVTKMYEYVNSGSASTTGTSTVTLNTWNHVAWVRSGTTVTMYLNGTSNGSITSSYSQGATTVTICSRYTGATEFITGYVDDLRITKGYARYTANFTPPTAAFPNN